VRGLFGTGEREGNATEVVEVHGEMVQRNGEEEKEGSRTSEGSRCLLNRTKGPPIACGIWSGGDHG
jgi:hypothetical protein